MRRREQRAQNNEHSNANQEAKNMDEANVNDGQTETRNGRRDRHEGSDQAAVDGLDKLKASQSEKRPKKEQRKQQMENNNESTLVDDDTVAQIDNLPIVLPHDIQNTETANNDKTENNEKNEYHLDEAEGVIEGMKRWNNRFSAGSAPKTELKSTWELQQKEDALNEASKWSERSFWLLFAILFVNVTAIIYCIYGRQIKACLDGNKQSDFEDINMDKKCRVDDTSSTDFDDDTEEEEEEEEYV